MTDIVTETGLVTRPWRGTATLRRLTRRPAIVIALAWVVGILLAGFFAPLPHDPVQPDATAILDPPSAQHWFGTDMHGFDVFSRTIASAAWDLPIVLIGVAASLLIGVPAGLLVGSKSRWSERIMRGLDAFQAFPLLVLAIAVVSLAGQGLGVVVFAIVIINVPVFMRLIRSEALSLRESRFIEAAHAMGASPSRVMFRHMLPNVLGVTLAQSSLAAAHAIVVIAALGFLSVGVRLPDPSWGLMVASGSTTMATGHWWVVTFPGLAISLTVLAFNVIADGLQGVTEES